MLSSEGPRYRLNLAEGFRLEAHEDIQLKRWRSCVDNSQLAVENAAKVALALLGPVGRTHDPAKLIRKLLDANRFPTEIRSRVDRLAECAEVLGPQIHIQSDYGDDERMKTPWQLFGETAARDALETAEEALQIAGELVK
ncbi:MAG: HEPN domain-containing protein [Chloroflexota bacterium]|nr:HEPN domain-containing protein [Chloroflexota bacterium]